MIKSGSKFWREIHFYGENLTIYYMFERNFMGTKTFGGKKQLGSTAPECPLGYGPACKAKALHLDENIAASFFG